MLRPVARGSLPWRARPWDLPRQYTQGPVSLLGVPSSSLTSPLSRLASAASPLGEAQHPFWMKTPRLKACVSNTEWLSALPSAPVCSALLWAPL